MSNPFDKVLPGHNIRRTDNAILQNAMIDAAQFVKSKQFDGGAIRGNSDIDLTRVLVKNTTGVAWDRFAPVEIGAVFVTPTAEDELFGFDATASASGSKTIAVTLEAIPPGEIGEAAITGCVACQIDITDAGHTSAKGDDGTKLMSAASGGVASIVWKPSGTGVKWCVVLIGGGGGSAISGGTCGPIVTAISCSGGVLTVTTKTLSISTAGVPSLS